MLTEFFAITNLATNPDPVFSAYHVAYVVWAPATPLAEYLQRDPAGTWWTGRRWPWCSPAAEGERPSGAG